MVFPAVVHEWIQFAAITFAAAKPGFIILLLVSCLVRRSLRCPYLARYLLITGANADPRRKIDKSRANALSAKMNRQGLLTERSENELQHNVLVLDLNPAACSLGNCGKLAHLMHKFPAGQVRLQSRNQFPPERASLTPEIVLFRPAPDACLEDLTRSLRQQWNRSAVLALFCAGWDNTRKVLQSVQHSGDDFLSCPFGERDLFLRMQRLLCRDRKPVWSLNRAIKEELQLDFLIGESECFLGAIEKLPAFARSNASVVIAGETGTGKELFARAIHYQGDRKGKPFIPVNCGALPDHLFENELFGHVKGAFTDASTAEKGLIAEAESGTLFLDEVDALSSSAQVKLLRFLQDREYRPLGSSRSVVADVRVIAATNADLMQQVKAKLFREDLYYRLNALSLCVPPLRERTEDIALLCQHFLAGYAREHGQEARQISHGTLRRLMAYSWPGNVRELESVITRALVLGTSEVLQSEDIDLPSPSAEQSWETQSLRERKAKTVLAFERDYLINLLTTHRGNVTRAAQAAGKERRAFQRLLRKHALDRHQFQS